MGLFLACLRSCPVARSFLRFFDARLIVCLGKGSSQSVEILARRERLTGCFLRPVWTRRFEDNSKPGFIQLQESVVSDPPFLALAGS